jgi:hypothetical protein
MPQDQKSVQQPKRNRGDDEQVYRCDTVGVIAKEGFPALRRWPPSLCHACCYSRLADVAPELEQFAVNPRRSPQGICSSRKSRDTAGCYF